MGSTYGVEPWPKRLPALEALDRGGQLAIAGIYLSDIPTLNYERYLFEERSVCSVTANTRADGNEFLEIAVRIGIQVSITPHAFDQPTLLWMVLPTIASMERQFRCCQQAETRRRFELENVNIKNTW
jgi:D-arabinose 1-dehydrogenase-like Zn-dependent alcohol dehydrogenase